MQFQFNAQAVAPMTARTALPEGTYPVVIHSSEIAAGKLPTDQKINFVLRVTGGDLVGATFPMQCLTRHSNPVAQEMGQARISAICHATGVLQITDTNQLHGKPFQVKTTVRTDDGDASKKYTEVVEFFRADGTAITYGGSPGAAGGAAPNWVPGATPAPAGGAPTPAPSPTPAPAPASVAPTPAPVAAAPAPAAPAAAPVAAPVKEKVYYALFNGAVITPTPLPLSQIAGLPQGVDNLQINEEGTPTWVAARSLIPAGAPAGATATVTGTPPWQQG